LIHSLKTILFLNSQNKKIYFRVFLNNYKEIPRFFKVNYLLKTFLFIKKEKQRKSMVLFSLFYFKFKKNVFKKWGRANFTYPDFF
jgi:hypothetical protein